MTQFNSYARTLDEAAKASFAEFRTIEKAYRDAEAKMREYPPRHGVVDAIYAAKSASAKADFEETKAAYMKAKRAFEESGSQFKDMRNELAAKIDAAYMADPAQLNPYTLELLKSGILKSNEYAKLLSDAKASKNATMVRIIGSYADKASIDVANKYGQGDKEAKALRVVVHESQTYTGADRLEAFDTMISIYNRCTRNPAMIDKWDFLLSETIKNF